MAFNTNIFSKGTATYKDFDISMRANPFNGDIRVKEDIESIKQSLMTLIYTNYGERPMQPHIGSNINQLLFSPMDSITKRELSFGLTNMIKNWEPRINIEKIDIAEDTDKNSIKISLYFNILNISNPQKIDILLKRGR